MCVRKGRYVAFRYISCRLIAFRYFRLCPAVLDCLSSCIQRKIIYCCCPSLILGKDYFLYFFSSLSFLLLHQLYGKFLWSLAILVIRIGPLLLHSHTRLCSLMCVRKDRYVAFRFISCKLIAFRYFRLCPAVRDRLSCRIQRKIFYCCCPVVILCKGHFLYQGCFFTSYLLQQLHLKAIRTLAILIVIIRPYLLYSDACRFRSMGVCNLIVIIFVARRRRLISSRYTCLDYCICNLLSVLI